MKTKFGFIIFISLFFISCNTKYPVENEIKFSVEEKEIINETDPYKGYYLCILKTAASGYEQFINKEIFYQESTSSYGNVYNKGCSNSIEEMLNSNQFTIQYLGFLHDKYIVLDYFPTSEAMINKKDQKANVIFYVTESGSIGHKSIEEYKDFLSKFCFIIQITNNNKVIYQKRHLISELIDGAKIELSYGDYNCSIFVYDENQNKLFLEIPCSGFSINQPHDTSIIFNLAIASLIYDYDSQESPSEGAD